GLAGEQHELVSADVMTYLSAPKRSSRRFTLAVVDPPSFFNNRGANVSFDINVDHPELLRAVLGVMAPGATVIFSTNHQRFEPRFEGLAVAKMEELTPRTIPEDYRNRGVHRCWKMAVA
ncbi:MAG: SAM-dependent methyltransferase, partial [Candidatus Omnitrophota bacterium]